MTRGRRTPRRGVSARGIEQRVADLRPRHWYRADTLTTSGGNLATLVNRGTAGGSLTVTTGTLAAPAADAGLAGQLSVTFAGTQDMQSSLAASEFSFLHSGLVETLTTYVPQNAAATQAVWGTRTEFGGDIGGSLLVLAGATRFNITNAAGAIVQANGAITQGVGVCHGLRYLEGGTPEWTLAKNFTSEATGASSGAPDAAAPTGTFTLGATSALILRFVGRIADVILFDRVLSETERQVLDIYHSRYGL